MADNRRLTEEQKRRIAEAHKRAAASRSTGASGKTASASVASATAGGKTASSKSTASASTSSKAAKTVTGSEKKKMTSKMKQTVRKSIAGVCLVSSLIIAAIPGDKSGVAKALDPSWAPSNSMDYSGASADSRNDDVELSGKDFLTYDASVHSGKEWSFCIYESGAGYMLDSQFESYDAGAHSVISSYNQGAVNSPLKVTQVIAQKYDGPDVTDYEDFVENMKNRYFELPAKDDGYVDSYRLDASGAEIDHKDYKFTLLQNYLKSTEDGTTQIKDDESISRFFSDINNHSGCAVRKVLNGTTNKSGSEQYPDTDRELYIYQHVEGNWSDPVDANDFCIASNSWKKIDAIADDAFKGLSCPEVIIDDRIIYLGNQGFQNSDIEIIDLSGIKEIGNRVFQGCDDLETVYLSKNVSGVGKEAFQGCSALRAIGEKSEISGGGDVGAKFPASLTQLAFGSFADCTSLSTVDFSKNDGLNVTIGEYAFYDTLKLSGVNFPSDASVAMGTAAFALPSGNQTLEEFTFPIMTMEYVSPSDASKASNYSFEYRLDDEYGNYESIMGDYVLANRTGLKNVTFKDFGTGYTPADDKSKWQWLPYNTFMGCSGMEKVDFGPNKFVAYDYKAFRDVANTDFCVWGPMDANEVTIEPGAHYARPRYCTWTAVPNDTSAYIPYCYEVKDSSGNVTRHYEVGQETGDVNAGTDCRYICDIIADRPAGGQATLYNCIYFPGDENKELGRSLDDPFMLPDQIGTYKLTNLGANCFENNLLNHIKNFKVNDSLLEIGDAAFTNAAALETVTMGKGIQSIGEGAFRNSDNLEHVYWGMESAINNIKSDAFMTGGQKLYFHGNVSDGFYPYAYAMDTNYINNNNTRICYVSDFENSSGDFSGGLCMLYDNGSKAVTLIDYPHINDSYDNELAQINQKLRDGSSLTDKEQKIRDASIYLVLPSQITSIDTKAFINDRNNEMNLVYFADALNTGGPTREKIYSVDNVNYPSGQEHHIGGYHAGIFSGEMEENKDNFMPSVSGRVNGLKVTNPDNVKGNDWIQSIRMPGVTKLPDYAFDSCENLQSVILNGNCQNIGKNVFQGCSSLQPGGVTIEDPNSKYTYDNSTGILYQNLDNGSRKVLSCLPTVKNPIELGEDVSELNEEAFCGCEYVPSFDMNKTTIRTIPERAFDHCRLASTIKLPETVDSIENEAFDNSASNVTIQIPNTGSMDISDKAFDPDAARVTLRGYRNSTPEKKANRSTTDNLYFEEIGTVYTMVFRNDDNSVVYEYKIYLNENETSGRGEFPPENPTPKLYPEHDGYSFSRWVWIGHEDVEGNDLITNVTEDREFTAFYVKADTPSYTVTFKNDDGSIIREDTVYEGSYIQPPTGVTSKNNPGYAFVGWTFQPETFDESMAVKQDIVATAKYSVDVYTVKFYYDDMTLYKEISVEKNGYLPALEIPESKLNPGNQYLGWKFSPSSFKITDRVTQDGIIGVAAYSSSKIPDGFHSVTFYNDDDTIFMEYTVPDGGPIYDPGQPKDSGRHPNSGYSFDKWSFHPTSYNVGSAVSENVIAVAVWEYLEYKHQSSATGTPTSTPTPTVSRNSASSNEAGYLVTVENGAGTGRHKPGEVVTITAYAATEGKIFDRWTTSNADIGFSNAYAVATTFIMPTHDVKVTATYKSANATPTASANAANATATPTPNGNGNNNNNNNNSNNSNNNNSASGNNANKTQPAADNNGTEVRITSETIDNNKKNLGTASVAGSTDNFVVKVTDSAAATAAVEQALRNAYGDRFSDLKYVAFDISLYDSTGTRLVTNANNLAVTITLPIPDQLVPYAGNNKAAAIAGGSVEPLGVQYTTIDGVPCMRFTATHFSPYTIYVDTQNMVRGVSDITPKTGDGIAPKWFLSAGMLSLSCVLFLWKDKKKVVK